MKTYVRLLLAVGLILSSLAAIAQLNSTASIEGSVVEQIQGCRRGRHGDGHQ